MKFSLKVICFLPFVFLSLTDHQQVLAAASRGDEIAANALDLSIDDRQLKKGKRNVKKICKKKCKLSEDKKCVKQCRNEEKKKKKTNKKNKRNKKNPKPTDDIPTTAVKAGDFNTLVAALDAADLVGAISEPKGPFTVFAPTDDAFAKLSEGLVPCLLEPRNKQFLTDVLLYHVASPQVLSTDLSDGQKIETLLDGSSVDISIRDGVQINDSMVTQADVLTSNGVIHIIDAVLVPDGKLDDMVCESKPEDCSYLGVWKTAGQTLIGPTHTCLCTAHGWVDCVLNQNERKTIQQFVLDSNEFTTLEVAVVQAGLVGVLDGDGPFTLFAPNDNAFANVPWEVLDFLLDDANKDALGKVLKYHIVAGTGINSEDIPGGTLDVSTVLGGSDKIKATKKCFSTLNVEAGEPTCDTYSLKLDDGSDVIVTDVHASNGIIHVINKVLVPPSLRAAVASLLE